VNLLVGCFSPLGSGKRLDLLLETWNLVARCRSNLSLVLIGVTRDEMLRRVTSIPLDDRVTCTGYLAPEEVSRLMGCLAVLLAPYVDGVSARRTAAIAAMAHGVPIVTTLGHLTDRSLFEGSPIRLVDGNRPDALATAVEDLLSSDREREEVGKRTRWFYEQHFAWGVIAKRVAEVAAAA
jgi:glycosyltransferase involved in cell wall biosynthesis